MFKLIAKMPVHSVPAIATSMVVKNGVVSTQHDDVSLPDELLVVGRVEKASAATEVVEKLYGYLEGDNFVINHIDVYREVSTVSGKYVRKLHDLDVHRCNDTDKYMLTPRAVLCNYQLRHDDVYHEDILDTRNLSGVEPVRLIDSKYRTNPNLVLRDAVVAFCNAKVGSTIMGDLIGAPTVIEIAIDDVRETAGRLYGGYGDYFKIPMDSLDLGSVTDVDIWHVEAADCEKCLAPTIYNGWIEKDALNELTDMFERMVEHTTFKADVAK